MDKLFASVNDKGNVCIGLDTNASYIPKEALSDFSNEADAVFAYNKAIIDAAGEAAACFKVQIAYYEAAGIEGMRCYAKTLQYLRKKKLLSIADIKRGDIADTASQYAKAHFTNPDFAADFVTLNPYMGMDTLSPWLAEAKKSGGGGICFTSHIKLRLCRF